MSTENLIRELVRDARPVRRLRPLALRALGWIALTAVSFAILLVFLGVRRELGDAADRADFAVETALLVLTALSAAIGALLVSLPGGERSALVRWVPVGIATVALLWAAGELVVASNTGAPAGRLTFSWPCVYRTALIAAVPGVALFVMVRRAAPMHAAWAGLLAVLSTSAVGVLGANVVCPNDRPLHMLLWHTAPLMLFAAIGAALGAWLLRWDPRGPRGRPS